MADHRKNAGRRCKVDSEALIYYVRSIFVALESGIVTLPKCLYHHSRQLERAYAGDLSSLRQAIKTVMQRSKIVRINANDAEQAINWKQGMASHIHEILMGLTAFESLLTAYHKVIDVNSKQVSKVTFGLNSFKRNKELSESRDEYETDYCQPGRQRI